jgi:hypothetical protein
MYVLLSLWDRQRLFEHGHLQRFCLHTRMIQGRKG